MLCTLIKTAQRMYRLTKQVYLVFRFYSKVSIIIDMLLALLFIVLVGPYSKIMVQSRAKGIISNQRFVSRPSASSLGNAVPSSSHNHYSGSHSSSLYKEIDGKLYKLVDEYENYEHVHDDIDEGYDFNIKKKLLAPINLKLIKKVEEKKWIFDKLFNLWLGILEAKKKLLFKIWQKKQGKKKKRNGPQHYEYYIPYYTSTMKPIYHKKIYSKTVQTYHENSKEANHYDQVKSDENYDNTKEKSVKYDKDKDSDNYIDQIPSTTELYETLPTKYVTNKENFEDSTENNSEGVWTSVQRIIFN